MTGWKTKSSGLLLIVSGLGVCAGSISFDPFSLNGEQFVTGVGMISAGLGIMGIGHKIEKGIK